MEIEERTEAQQEKNNVAENTENTNRDSAKVLKEVARRKKLYANLHEAASWVLVVAVAMLLAYGTNHFLICNAVIPTGSMENTIMPGDRIIGNRLRYLFSDPERGDIVIFNSPIEEGKLLVKRIIGLPGETVDITDGHIYIDGNSEPLEETYRKDEEWTELSTGLHFEVPEGCYLVLGDNRNNSEDARYWETVYHVSPYIEKEDILAKAWIAYWPFSHFGVLK